MVTSIKLYFHGENIGLKENREIGRNNLLRSFIYHDLNFLFLNTLRVLFKIEKYVYLRREWDGVEMIIISSYS